MGLNSDREMRWNDFRTIIRDQCEYPYFLPTWKLKEDLFLDSLDMTEISLKLEEKFHVHLNEQDVGECTTVWDLYMLLLSNGFPNEEDVNENT